MSGVIHNPKPTKCLENREYLKNEKSLSIWKFLDQIEKLDSEFDLSAARQELTVLCAEFRTADDILQTLGVNLNKVRERLPTTI